MDWQGKKEGSGRHTSADVTEQPGIGKLRFQHVLGISQIGNRRRVVPFLTVRSELRDGDSSQDTNDPTTISSSIRVKPFPLLILTGPPRLLPPGSKPPEPLPVIIAHCLP